MPGDMKAVSIIKTTLVLLAVLLNIGAAADAAPIAAGPGPILTQNLSFAFVYPLMSPRTSSKFGQRLHPRYQYVRHHSGVDLAAPKGTPIRAVREGRVVFADPYGEYGRLVVIDHGHGITSHYGHCDTIIGRTGERVQAGQVIATVGSTGVTTGPHLHFEIRVDGQAKDPDQILKGLDAPAQG